MTSTTASTLQGNLFPELVATLDYLDQSDRVQQLAQRVTPICAEEGKAYPATQIQSAATTVVALREAQKAWPDWLQTYVKERPVTKADVDAKKAALMVQHKRRKKRSVRSLALFSFGTGGFAMVVGGLSSEEWGLAGMIGLGFTLVVGLIGSLFTLDETPEQQECLYQLQHVVPDDTGWPKLAASTEASALYRAWTAGGQSITQRDWLVLMQVGEMEAGRKAQQQVLMHH